MRAICRSRSSICPRVRAATVNSVLLVQIRRRHNALVVESQREEKLGAGFRDLDEDGAAKNAGAGVSLRRRGYQVDTATRGLGRAECGRGRMQSHYCKIGAGCSPGAHASLHVPELRGTSSHQHGELRAESGDSAGRAEVSEPGNVAGRADLCGTAATTTVGCAGRDRLIGGLKRAAAKLEQVDGAFEGTLTWQNLSAREGNVPSSMIELPEERERLRFMPGGSESAALVSPSGARSMGSQPFIATRWRSALRSRSILTQLRRAQGGRAQQRARGRDG